MAFVEKSGHSRWRVRYWKDDGTHGSIPGFTTKKAAQNHANQISTDQQRGTFLDPAAGKLTLAEWAQTWLDGLDVEPATESQYRCVTRNHLVPRWGSVNLSDISGSAVRAWSKQLRARGYAHNTVILVHKILTMMLADAADERLIPANPIRPQRRGKRRRTPRTESIWATPEQALKVALQAGHLVGPWATVFMLTAAYTGARWGELTGLQRHNLDLQHGTLTVDPDIGALHEVDNILSLGPPKTAESARTIRLPPFLTELLRNHLQQHTHPHVFVTANGDLLRRSNFARRAMRPAADGTHHKPRSPHKLTPIASGLTFHGFRHSHKTWMIADGIPDIAQSRRLGHILPDKIQEIYSHVADEVEQRLLDNLQQRWQHSLTTLHHPPPHTTANGGLPKLLTRTFPSSNADEHR